MRAQKITPGLTGGIQRQIGKVQKASLYFDSTTGSWWEKANRSNKGQANGNKGQAGLKPRREERSSDGEVHQTMCQRTKGMGALRIELGWETGFSRLEGVEGGVKSKTTGVY